MSPSWIIVLIWEDCTGKVKDNNSVYAFSQSVATRESNGAQISPGFGHYPSLLSVAEMKHQLQSSCRGKGLVSWHF